MLFRSTISCVPSSQRELSSGCAASPRQTARDTIASRPIFAPVSAVSRALSSRAAVTSIVWNTVTCGAVNALATIAAATDRGLVVPNVKDAGTLALPEMAAALAELTSEARAGKASPERLTGGTFTITNIGVFGVEAGTPILNPGEAGILALGAAQRRPWEFEGGIALREVMTLSLSFDHRVVDGEQGSRFLAELGARLERADEGELT